VKPLHVTGAALALALFTTTPATAAAPRQAGSPKVTVKAGWVSNAALAKDPSLYGKLGIPKRTAASPAGSASATPFTSDTKCFELVCGKVYGTGLTITKVWTSAEGDGTEGCIHAHYVIVLGTDYADGTVIRTATGSQVCGGGVPGTYYYNFDNQVPDKLPYTCPSTSTLGVFWDRIPGDPTFEIHP
jgi:hypothetical protein